MSAPMDVDQAHHNGKHNNAQADASIAKKRKQVNGAAAAPDSLTINGSSWPQDWPDVKGDIDLSIHDLPHDSSETEWWYVNSHITCTPVNASSASSSSSSSSSSAKGAPREFSLFASFFRTKVDWSDALNGYDHSHALTWGLVDPLNQKYIGVPILDRKSPKVILKMLQDPRNNIDPMLHRAMSEIYGRDQVCLPDRALKADARVALDRLELHYDANTFIKDAATGDYICHCESSEEKVEFTLRFSPRKHVIRHGHDGVVKIGRKGDDMFYYFIPRLHVTGTITVDGQLYEVTEGRGWYDHEFGGKIRDSKTKEADSKTDDEPIPDYAWNWLAAQLDDGTDISAATVVNVANNTILDNFGIVIHPDSTRVEENENVEFSALDSWTSVRTTCKYPQNWRYVMPKSQVDLVLTAVFPQQELITVIAKPAFWEGKITIKGTIRGKPVTGVGFVERHGFHPLQSLDTFFGVVSDMVREEVHKILPLDPTDEQMRELVAAPGFEHYLDGLDRNVYINSVVKPLREIVDRGGKSWRSWAFTLSVDCVGGSSFDMRVAMAMPEILHVGSLVVDDVQDRSLLRRGGPTCHAVYGEPLAINCGTAAYFLGLNVVNHLTIPPLTRLRLYETYFLTLRAGHAGQALDIKGLDHLMDAAVATGDNETLEKAIICTHRLKSASPAGNLARIGAMLGGGTDIQIDLLGNYYESLGVAFQIIDDVLNLSGIKTKDLGEDIKAGKVTHPVAVAMSGKRLDAADRKWLWETLKSKPQDVEIVKSVIRKIEACGALLASQEMATQLVEEAWARADPVLPPSYYKMHLRAFGFYVLRRHY